MEFKNLEEAKATASEALRKFIITRQREIAIAHSVHNGTKMHQDAKTEFRSARETYIRVCRAFEEFNAQEYYDWYNKFRDMEINPPLERKEREAYNYWLRTGEFPQ